MNKCIDELSVAITCIDDDMISDALLTEEIKQFKKANIAITAAAFVVVIISSVFALLQNIPFDMNNTELTTNGAAGIKEQSILPEEYIKLTPEQLYLHPVFGRFAPKYLPEGCRFGEIHYLVTDDDYFHCFFIMYNEDNYPLEFRIFKKDDSTSFDSSLTLHRITDYSKFTVNDVEYCADKKYSKTGLNDLTTCGVDLFEGDTIVSFAPYGWLNSGHNPVSAEEIYIMIMSCDYAQTMLP